MKAFRSCCWLILAVFLLLLQRADEDLSHAMHVLEDLLEQEWCDP